jgi:type IV secretory pathway VirB2 component (pilin)
MTSLSTTNFKNDSYFNIRFLYAIIFSFWISMSSVQVLASDPTGPAYDKDDPIGYRLCQIVGVLQGNTAKAVSICALFSVAIGLFMGKINWGVALTTASGVVVIFGAGTIVGFLGGTGVDSTCGAAKPA